MTRRPSPLGTYLFVAGISASLALSSGGVLGMSQACAGLAFAGVGVACLPARPRFAAVNVAAAAGWFLRDAAPALAWVHWPLMVAAALAFPDGRLPRPLARALVAGLAVAAVRPQAAMTPQVTLALGGWIAATAWWELASAVPEARSAGRTRAGATIALSLALVLPATVRWIDPRAALDPFVASGLDLVHCGLIAMAGGILLTRLALGVEESDAESVVALSEVGASAVLERLRRQAHATTDQGSRRALAAATELLERNQALQAELATAVEDVRTSRRRLVEATDVERASLRRRLADRALPALPAIDALVESVQRDADSPLADQCRAELAAIRDDLDLLAQGLHPVALGREGLAGLREVAATCPIPVQVHVPAQRMAPEVEAAAWYACTEALANAAKHAHATSVTLDLDRSDGILVGTIRDDGIGGATFAPEGGLAGLRDRLEAVGARIRVDSPLGGGTTVRIEVPLP